MLKHCHTNPNYSSPEPIRILTLWWLYMCRRLSLDFDPRFGLLGVLIAHAHVYNSILIMVGFIGA